ncbi:Crp/Fnr family transcriptional regulator [Gloeobacter violaceus]|uniref:Global nitrogen regulator n=1 Tax=Gloeobacter violaceus (strain ATCC 29082 / PCC 7421) TaxID=251221 RepID=Q7MBD0_GLOVI|nr:Crp/Fnr family transcriptional regulator [Gloeobacter violaceus]BAC88266.1 Crp family transcriptional regulatory protein [Gloeobacter violaceus PCC 7421]
MSKHAIPLQDVESPGAVFDTGDLHEVGWAAGQAAGDCYKAGQSIPLAWDSLWLVQQGLVWVRTVQWSGNETLVALVGPRMPIGAMLVPEKAACAVHALTDVQLTRVAWREVHQQPQLAWQLNQGLVRLLLQLEALNAIKGLRRVIDRLQEMLVLLVRQCGQESVEGVRLQGRLTHEQLAVAIGCQRVAVTKCFTELKRAGLVTVGADRRLCVSRELVHRTALFAVAADTHAQRAMGPA